MIDSILFMSTVLHAGELQSSIMRPFQKPFCWRMILDLMLLRCCLMLCCYSGSECLNNQISMEVCLHCALGYIELVSILSHMPWGETQIIYGRGSITIGTGKWWRTKRGTSHTCLMQQYQPLASFCQHFQYYLCSSRERTGIWPVRNELSLHYFSFSMNKLEPNLLKSYS